MYVPPVGQTAGPNKMKFFVGTHWNPGVTYFYFFLNYFFPRAAPGLSGSNT